MTMIDMFSDWTDMNLLESIMKCSSDIQLYQEELRRRGVEFGGVKILPKAQMYFGTIENPRHVDAKCEITLYVQDVDAVARQIIDAPEDTDFEDCDYYTCLRILHKGAIYQLIRLKDRVQQYED